MNRLLLFCLGSLFFFYLSAFSQNATKIINYPPLRNLPVDSPKLQKILSEIAGQEGGRLLRRDGTAMQFEVIQHIKGSHYLAKKMRGKETLAKLELSEKTKIIADGEFITVTVNERDELYQYITVLGAKKTIPIWKESGIPDIHIITNQAILNRLKKGEKFTLDKRSSSQKQCKKCTGSGKVYSARSASKKQLCKDCGGRGKKRVEVIQRIFIKW